MFEPHSPLASRIERGGRDGADGRRTLELTEIRPVNLVQLGIFAGGEAPLDALVRELTGSALPLAANVVASVGGCRLYRIAPDQVWIRTPDSRCGRELERRVPAAAGTVTVLDAARVCLRVAGASAAALLAHHVPLDLDATVFAPGHFAQTGIAHAGVLLERLAPQAFEMLMLRTFAASTFDLLIDSAWPYGYDLDTQAAAGGGPAASVPR